jgi:hypothetical protein
LAPPILFPKEGASGVVLDQKDKPVPNAPMRAYWSPVRILYMFAPAYHEDFTADKNGHWEFYQRKVAAGIDIEALPFDGYERTKSSLQGVHSWNVNTQRREPQTNIILRLRKIEEPSK